MTRTNTKTRNKTRGRPPSYIAYYVPERDKAPWTRVGAAWEHRDGDGLNLQLDLVPVDGGRIVLRVYDPDVVEADDGDAEAPSAPAAEPAGAAQ